MKLHHNFIIEQTTKPIHIYFVEKRLQSNLYVRPSRKRPPVQNNLSQSLTVGASSKRPPPVSDRDHFLGLTGNDFLLFLTSGNRPLDAFSDLYVHCVHYVT